MSVGLVQYIVIRADLLTNLKWPVGALIAQGCHASSAALHLFRSDANTQSYLADLDRMHKIVLQANDEESLNKLSQKLTAENIDHKLWIEQPENIPTCVATKPYKKEDIQKYLKHFKLFK